MTYLKYWYISKHPETGEIMFNINLPRPEKDIVFTRTSEGWDLQTSENIKYTLTWENNYRELHNKACFCDGVCIFIKEAKIIDNIFLSLDETSKILDLLCADNKGRENLKSEDK